MSGPNNKQKRSSKKDPESDLTRLADAAFRQAAKKVIQRALNSWTPVIIWEKGQIKKVDPRTLLATGKRRQMRGKRES